MGAAVTPIAVRARAGVIGAILAVLTFPALAWAQPAPITYRVTFPEPQHHWMQVEMTVGGLAATPLRARMSRSSPGRYAVHEFAKNIFLIDAFDGAGARLSYTHTDIDEWEVGGHDGTVRIVYRIFGDLADGTYLGIDTTHAHINMPAAFMWVSGLENRAMRVTFVPPAGSSWEVGTQLFPTTDPYTFTAPNLQYFMDSPTEVSAFVLSTFTVPGAGGAPSSFRLVVHGEATQGDADELAKLVQRLVREELLVYGEFPKFEPGYYTFLLDYSAWTEDDGMEHRNSTFITDPSIRLHDPASRRAALDTIAHEFFHTWNVERIRPAGLEPFDLTRENVTCCLWLAEGFTQYYGLLLQARAGFGHDDAVAGLGRYAATVMTGSARQVRSAVQMSEYAPFADAATAIDPTDQSRTFISYYTYGAAIAMALDLSIREQTNGASSLDDYMGLLWQRFGRSADMRVGYVGRPYTLKDLRDVLGDVVKDKAFADRFFDRFVEGRDVADYAALLAPAGYVVRVRSGDAGWVGSLSLAPGADGLTIDGLVPFGTPAYDAGLDSGDLITNIDGRRATIDGWNAFHQKKPGETVTLTVRRRDGKTLDTVVTLKPDPSLEIDDLGKTGTLTEEQRTFRAAWLGSKAK
jgi:predicted metalloprotease with PDZ domain